MLKQVLIIGLLALFASSVYLFTQKAEDKTLDPIVETWEAWKHKYSKNYATAEEEAYRFRVFLQTLKYISENQGETYTLGINLFSDLTNDEFRASYLMPKGTIESFHTEETAFTVPADFAAPSTVNWVSQGKTIEVLNQGQCGSCWAFSTVESIDSAYAVTQNIAPPNLSEQQVVSCTLLYGELGCNGGNVVPAYKYVMAHPLTTNALYPYVSGNTQKTGACNTQLANAGTWKITGYKTVPSGACSTLQASIATTPTSVCVDASTWQNYQSGIFTNCGTQLDHCVLATGYNDTGNAATSYWEIQNSWTTAWGQSGFIQLGWGNTCGVCQQAQIPTVPAN